MVVLEHLGYGGRERQLWLYYWDERDGEDFQGWWITPDLIGNNDFILCSSCTEARTPDACKLGEWRSPHVEAMQLKRKIVLKFERTGDGEALRVVGPDAATPLIPDGVCKVDLSKFVWKPEGMNHGRTAYLAHEGVATAAEEANKQAGASPLKPLLYGILGLLAGVACTLALTRRRP